MVFVANRGKGCVGLGNMDGLAVGRHDRRFLCIARERFPHVYNQLLRWGTTIGIVVVSVIFQDVAVHRVLELLVHSNRQIIVLPDKQIDEKGVISTKKVGIWIIHLL